MVDNLARTIESNVDTSVIIKGELNKQPLKWCSVSLAEVLNRGHRLEASVYDVEAKKARQIITDNIYGVVPLSGSHGLISSAYYPGRFKRIYCSKQSGIPFYLPSQMTDIYPRADKYISALTKCNINDLKLSRNTLLLTRSGTIGTVSMVSKTLEDTVFSDDVIRVKFKNAIDLGYVYTFLKSNIGNLILETNGYGSVITHLEPEHLEEMIIPNAPQKLREKIHNLIMRSFDLRDESNELIDKATAILINELHLPSIEQFELNLIAKLKNVQTYSVKLSETFSRLDGSYHVPIINAIINHLEQHAEKVTTVGNSCISKAVILPGRFKRIYVEEGCGRTFIGGKQLYELDPSNKKYLSLTHHNERIGAQLQLKENMTLISRSGTIGKVTITPKHWEHWVASEHVIRIVPANNEIAGYLSIFLSSSYGKALITRFTYGSVVDEIDDNHVKQIKIPLLKDKKMQETINNLALQANEKRYQAYKLEQEALKIMDEDVIGVTRHK